MSGPDMAIDLLEDMTDLGTVVKGQVMATVQVMAIVQGMIRGPDTMIDLDKAISRDTATDRAPLINQIKMVSPLDTETGVALMVGPAMAVSRGTMTSAVVVPTIDPVMMVSSLDTMIGQIIKIDLDMAQDRIRAPRAKIDTMTAVPGLANSAHIPGP